jgi:hypothetical protein
MKEERLTIKPPSMTIEELEEEIRKIYLLADVGIIRMILATIVGNRLNLSAKPIWLLILAGSSSGKSAMLDIVSSCGKWIVPIDAITTNTFASGLKRDEETSLLFKANNGVLVFKDFTTLTSMNEEGLREVMGQLRGIYDGSFNKKTGNNVEVDWHGKIGIIAGGTGAAARKMRQFSEQGERFINYIMKIAEPKEMTRRAMKNAASLKEKELELREKVSTFVNERLNMATIEGLEIPEEVIDEMIEIANFATLARSPITMDKKDPTMVAFVSEREQPMRMTMMYANLATALMVLSDEKQLSPLNASILYKSALDSIPVERRMVLSILAKYREANTKAIALMLHYDTVIVRAWCNQLCALKLIQRTKGGKGKGSGDIWKLEQEYKDVMCKYENIEAVDEMLEAQEDDDEEWGSAYITEAQRNDPLLADPSWDIALEQFGEFLPEQTS